MRRHLLDKNSEAATGEVADGAEAGMAGVTLELLHQRLT